MSSLYSLSADSITPKRSSNVKIVGLNAESALISGGTVSNSAFIGGTIGTTTAISLGCTQAEYVIQGFADDGTVSATISTYPLGNLAVISVREILGDANDTRLVCTDQLPDNVRPWSTIRLCIPVESGGAAGFGLMVISPEGTFGFSAGRNPTDPFGAGNPAHILPFSHIYDLTEFR